MDIGEWSLSPGAVNINADVYDSFFSKNDNQSEANQFEIQHNDTPRPTDSISSEKYVVSTPAVSRKYLNINYIRKSAKIHQILLKSLSKQHLKPLQRIRLSPSKVYFQQLQVIKVIFYHQIMQQSCHKIQWKTPI